MPEETYWRESPCGCRYLMGTVRNRYIDRSQVVDQEYCDEHHKRWTFIDFLCASPSRRERMMRSFDDTMKKYVRQRQREAGLI